MILQIIKIGIYDCVWKVGFFQIQSQIDYVLTHVNSTRNGQLKSSAIDDNLKDMDVRT